MTYISTTVEVVTEADVEIDVDDIIDQIPDETIREQYYERNLGDVNEDNEETELNKAYLAHHNGDKDKAYEILWELCLERLNKVV